MGTTHVLKVTRRRGSAISTTPAELTLDAAAFNTDSNEDGHFRIEAPSGWTVTAVGPLAWRVRPEAIAADRGCRFHLRRLPPFASRRSVGVNYRLDLHNAIDVEGTLLPVANRAESLGEINPTRDVFEKTFLPMPEPFKRLLFEGLYSDIVYIRLTSPRGGMCSGMAHWAIERGCGREPAPSTNDDALHRIAMYHGRQLCDRALLASLPWFLRGSSRAVFKAIRRDLLEHGFTDRAIDVDIPKLWRRDIARAVVAEGHVVVPMRLIQDGPDRGWIEVYDPNAPQQVGGEEPRTIEFDLKRNRYAYVHRVSLDDTNVGMIANRQRAYSQPGTAILALLGSLLFNPRRGLRSLAGAKAHART